MSAIDYRTAEAPVLAAGMRVGGSVMISVSLNLQHGLTNEQCS